MASSKFSAVGQKLLHAFQRLGKELLLFLRFIFTLTFLKHFTLAIAILVVLFFTLKFSLRSYTNHGEAMSVPDFRGLTLEDAQELAQGKSLELEIIDSVYQLAGKPGAIIDQTPPPDFKVKEGRTIFITKQKKERPKVEASDFTEISAFQALAEVRSLGLDVKAIEYKEKEFRDLVVGQKFKGEPLLPGTMLPKGSGIVLVVGKEEDQKTRVPSLTLLKLDVARYKALEADLNLGDVAYDQSIVTPVDSVNAVVWRQEPLPGGSKVKVGSHVDLYLTLKPFKLEIAGQAKKHGQ